MQTAEFIAEATGLETSHLRTVSRRLREADLLSQLGHGRGAAAATPQDAALLLLASALGVPSLHAVLIGEAILACTIGIVTDDETDARVLVGTALGDVAGRIATGQDVDLISIVLHNDSLSILVSNDRTSFNYQMPDDSPVRRKLAAKFGRPGRLTRVYRGQFRDGVLPEISEFLGIDAAEAEDSAA